ncbi:MAG: MOSC domain-containing protein [Rhodospirillales bacterium]|nr:MOSC domain-containing protein [Rhodospirillales bacterium]MDE0379281.1 MOSC domain-containing protein [Rhodospirillales bacterium]
MASQGRNGGTVKALWRYPVKSMAGNKLDKARVTEGGILGDRAYAVLDGTSGRVGSAKTPRKWAALMTLAADFVSPPEAGAPLPPVRVVWPDGTEATSDGGDADARLSRMLGRPVTLTAERPETPSLERLDPLAEEETIVDIGDLMMAGRFSDYAALHLITTATMARLAALRPESTFTARRFRPNVTIATPDGETGFVENGWVGRELAIGDAVRLRISDPTPRCSVPTIAQKDMEKDPHVLRTIVEHNRLPVPLLDGESLPCAGVYAFVIQAGTVKRGDAVRVI